MKMQIKQLMVWPLCLALIVSSVLVGNGDILCIGQDGHVEYETECLPCCSETDTVCEVKIPEDLHDDHDDCNDCFDLAPDSPLTPSRILNQNSLRSGIKFLVVTALPLEISTIAQVQTRLFLHSQTFIENPLTASIATVVLRC